MPTTGGEEPRDVSTAPTDDAILVPRLYRSMGSIRDETASPTPSTPPVRATASVTGVAFPARRAAVDGLLPDRLEALPVGPRLAAIGFLTVVYDRFDGGTLDPYREFGVVVPATPREAGPTPLAALRGTFGSYVWFLPVSTAAARDYGVATWGFPKVVADVAVADDGPVRTTDVVVDGEPFVSVAVDRPPAVPGHVPATDYVVVDGRLRRVSISLRGRVGTSLRRGRTTCALGTHRRAELLRAVGLRLRPVVRFSATGAVTIGALESVDDGT